jgi:hypothetical protein
MQSGNCLCALLLPAGYLTISTEGAYTLALFQTSDKRDGPLAALTFAAGVDPSNLQSGEWPWISHCSS